MKCMFNHNDCVKMKKLLCLLALLWVVQVSVWGVERDCAFCKLMEIDYILDVVEDTVSVLGVHRYRYELHECLTSERLFKHVFYLSRDRALVLFGRIVSDARGCELSRIHLDSTLGLSIPMNESGSCWTS